MFFSAGEIRRFAPRGGGAPPEAVILIHGLFMGGFHMTPLARRLAAAGYLAVEYDYPTRRHGFAGHGKEFRRYLEAFLDSEAAPRIHFVTHSMGAMVLRAALAQELSGDAASRLGRAVLLSPPNHGSPTAKLAVRIPGRPDRLWKPIAELSSEPGAAVHDLAGLPLPFGVIAAKYDHLVPEESNHLDGESDYLVLSALHSTLPLGCRCAEAVVNFLRTGNFIVI